MNRIFRECASLAFFAITAAASTAAVSSPSVASTSTLAIDGLIAANVLNWDGGDLRGSVVAGPASSSGLPTKRIGSVMCAPLRLEIAFPPSAGLVACINDLCANRFTRHTLLITEYNATGVPTEAFELGNAVLTEVTFPAFDATSPIGSLKLVFTPESNHTVTPGTSAKGSLPARTAASTFTLSVDGLDGRGVMRIEPFTVTCSTDSTSIGEARAYAKEPGKVAFSNLVVTLSTAKSSSWKTWRTDFVAKGHADDANEKKGALSVVTSTGKPIEPVLNFSQLGILRVSRMSAAAGTVARSEVELYFEGLKLEAAASVAGDSTASSSSASSAGSESSGSTVESTDAAAGKIAKPAATTPAAVDRTIGGVDAAPVAAPRSAAVVGATRAATSPDDKGSRDPAEFPRVSGLARQEYSGTFRPDYTTEGASYLAPEPIYDLVKRVEAAAKAAGWKMGTFEESEASDGKRVAESWTKGGASASLGFFQPKESTSTKLSLQVYVKISP